MKKTLKYWPNPHVCHIPACPRFWSILDYRLTNTGLFKQEVSAGFLIHTLYQSTEWECPVQTSTVPFSDKAHAADPFNLFESAALESLSEPSSTCNSSPVITHWEQHKGDASESTAAGVHTKYQT